MVKDFFIKFNKITWWEIMIILIIAIAVGIHDSKQEATLYVVCKDGMRQNVTPETQSVCNGIPVFYDPETDTYEIARFSRNQMTKDGINKMIDESLNCLITQRNLSYGFYNASTKSVRYEDSDRVIVQNEKET